MDINHHLHQFQQIADQLNKKHFTENHLQLKAGVWLHSAVLKIQKASWINSATTKPFEESIFFSVWISAASIRESKLYYNIHALKLRSLKNYTIKSREFAEAFRSAFRNYEDKWPNVSMQYGPQTLMEGWVSVDINDYKNSVIELAYKFVEIYFIIDDLLHERQKR